ncbi:Alpha/beta hydrolase family [Rubrobacter radiotolerans]|uniref:Alpha/beta hydrolase n=1 Tax=Rubrobacter radiotolerans TaxID=42256 RepID=A0A023X5Y4_RUBRA|nr:alpha/beta hydrolase [Rubrobacter radiotolerans]AHY47753.1 Alpha/beta hydrolase family [Rubrobacter radiotolerans]MDX5895229.1 alpha/beta hydrolase [Rubrobacter radiotolerans]SMC07683.1 Pimeloyl-ACP methyl ester carboxylesterase [Rubrobacter radiotolerans DSM 5868]
MAEIYDHAGTPVKHGRARVNGIRMHYVTAGEGEPLLLLHGTPKTHYYWYKLIPLLTERFTVVAPDLRGFGDTDRPPAEEGYDSLTNAADVTELMTQLGHETFHVHGEDRGAEFAYAVAATEPERVKTLSFCEMLLSGEGLEEWSYFTPENVSAQFNLKGVWLWHIPFFWIPHIPEMLISGHEREFWEFWIKAETYNPTAIADEAIDEWIARLSAPGGLRGVLETYRAGLKNARINKDLKKTKISLPILTIGAPEFFGELVKGQMEKVSEGVERSEVFEECGHSLALEAEDRLAKVLHEFMLDR